MPSGRFISYTRVSTARQGRSGLGLNAQREAVRTYLNGGSWTLIAEVTEIESGRRSDRPRLAEALKLCRIHNATLVIAKLDRLARNVAFISALMESGVEFVACDFPQANRLTVHILAAVAEHEAKAISDRTKAALAAAKARGTKLGRSKGEGNTMTDAYREKAAAVVKAKADARAQDLSDVIAHLKAEGASSLRELAAGLNGLGITTSRGGTWSAVQVQRVLSRQA